METHELYLGNGNKTRSDYATLLYNILFYKSNITLKSDSSFSELII